MNKTVAIGVVVGIVFGGIVTRTLLQDEALPRQETILGTVTAVSSSEDAFGFETDEGEKIGFPMPGPPEGVADIHRGAHLRLVVVEGSGFQLIVDATPA